MAPTHPNIQQAATHIIRYYHQHVLRERNTNQFRVSTHAYQYHTCAIISTYRYKSCVNRIYCWHEKCICTLYTKCWYYHFYYEMRSFYSIRKIYRRFMFSSREKKSDLCESWIAIWAWNTSQKFQAFICIYLFIYLYVYERTCSLLRSSLFLTSTASPTYVERSCIHELILYFLPLFFHLSRSLALLSLSFFFSRWFPRVCVLKPSWSNVRRVRVKSGSINREVNGSGIQITKTWPRANRERARCSLSWSVALPGVLDERDIERNVNPHIHIYLYICKKVMGDFLGTQFFDHVLERAICYFISIHLSLKFDRHWGAFNRTFFSEN